MKSLRVLMGLHAGASVDLQTGIYRIMRGEDEGGEKEEAGAKKEMLVRAVDICLLDWSVAPLLLEVTPTAVRQITFEAEARPDLEWQDGRVHRFGPVSLCVDEGFSPWPTGKQARVPGHSNGTSPSASTVFPPWIRSWEARACVIAAGLLLAVGAIYGQASPPSTVHPSSGETDQGALSWLRQNLHSMGMDELVVQRGDTDLVLRGMVANAEQAQSVRSAIAEWQQRSKMTLLEEWQVASDVSATIESALRRPGIHAFYKGSGYFVVKGAVSDPAVVRDVIVQLQRDLGVNVRGIESALVRNSTQAPTSAAVSADLLHYSERPDGAKVFVEKRM